MKGLSEDNETVKHGTEIGARKKTIPFPLSYRLILFAAVETDKRINRRIRYLQYDHADLLQSSGCDLARPPARPNVCCN